MKSIVSYVHYIPLKFMLVKFDSNFCIRIALQNNEFNYVELRSWIGSFNLNNYVDYQCLGIGTTENLKCEPCTKTFEEFRHYMAHFVQTHNTMPPGYESCETFKCEIENCAHIFLFKSRLDHHLKTVHGVGKKMKKIQFPKTYMSKPGAFHCPHCNKPMASDGKLKTHIRQGRLYIWTEHYILTIYT